MAHSEICPVCHGKGKLFTATREDTCHGCNGRGWVEVQDSGYPPYIPVPIQPFPQPYIPDPYTPWVDPNWTCYEHNNTAVQKDFPQWTMDSEGLLIRC